MSEKYRQMAAMKLTKSSCFFSIITVSLNDHRERKRLLKKLFTGSSVFQHFRPIENYQNVILNVALPADRQGSEVEP